MSAKQKIIDKINQMSESVAQLEAQYMPDSQVQPGDEQKPAKNLSNLIVNKIKEALPESRLASMLPGEMSVAEEKDYYRGLPQEMGMAAGSLLKADPKKIAAKLESAMAQGYKPTAAEGLALSKFKNNPITALPTAQEAAGFRAKSEIKKPVREMFNLPEKNLGALQSTPQGPVRMLKITQGSGI